MSVPLSLLDVGGRLRYWRKVYMPYNRVADCWTWTAAKDPNGYGRFGVIDKRTRLAHHVAYYLATGVDPAGQVVLHTCDNPSCVSPHHLKLGTHADNVADKVTKKRHRWRAHGGQANGMTKLSDADVLEIRRRLEQGETGASLARAFGVTESPIYRIRNGQRLLTGSTEGVPA